MKSADYADRALRMKEEFDLSFALPARTETPPSEDLLAIRIRGDGFALRALEMAGLATDRKLASLPGAPPALLGLAGIRGGLVPAWDLGSLLGYGGAGQGGRWLALGRGGSPWALAFDAFEGFFRVAKADVHPGALGGMQRNGGAENQFARETCTVGGRSRMVVSLPAVLRAIEGISQSYQARRG